MIWADRHDLHLEVIAADETPDGEFQILLSSNDALLSASEARRLAAALLNAADQIDPCG